MCLLSEKYYDQSVRRTMPLLSLTEKVTFVFNLHHLHTRAHTKGNCEVLIWVNTWLSEKQPSYKMSRCIRGSEIPIVLTWESFTHYELYMSVFRLFRHSNAASWKKSVVVCMTGRFQKVKIQTTPLSPRTILLTMLSVAVLLVFLVAHALGQWGSNRA